MRLLLILLGIFHGLNGVAMIAAPAVWYATVPGVVETGPLNTHFVRDIGFGFVAAAVGLFLAAQPGASRLMLWPAAIFLDGHALLHLIEMATHGASAEAALRDFLFILLPGLLPVWLALITTAKERLDP